MAVPTQLPHLAALVPLLLLLLPLPLLVLHLRFLALRRHRWDLHLQLVLPPSSNRTPEVGLV